MKFSWTFLNYLIDLSDIKFQEFQSKLILNGFEIESIQDDLLFNDKIIELSITSNRTDAHNLIGLAQEIGTIFGRPLKLPFINDLKSVQPISANNHERIIDYCIINQINNLNKISNISWIDSNLKLETNIEKFNHNIEKIQAYIKLKWGYDFYFLDTTKIFNNKRFDISQVQFIDNALKQNTEIRYNNTAVLNISKKEQKEYYSHKDSKATESYIIFFPLYNPKFNPYDNSSYYFNAYQDTILLLSSFSRCTIGYSYHINRMNKKSLKQDLILNVKVKYIQQILGSINSANNIFLQKNKIYKILKQLHFQPLYKYSSFDLKVPSYRRHDVIRDVDVIEEIARIYGFHNFKARLPSQYINGKRSKKSLIMQKIRHTLKHLGLREVINSSLVTLNNTNYKYNAQLYNCMQEDQNILRYNLIENLIHNYIYNLKNINSSIEIFEIGKIFYKYKNQIYEKLHIGGLIHNKEFTRTKWENKAICASWFHAKGILENFIEKLNIQILWKQIDRNNLNSIKHILHLFNNDQTIALYTYDNKLLGLFGQINRYYIPKNLSQHAYIFELNISQLMNSIKQKTHLTYIFKPYSSFPSVTRDISIKLSSEYTLDNIYFIILKQYNHWIESINIIDIYYDKILAKQSICLRITYRAYDKTLNTQDINEINNNLSYIINTLK